LFEGDQIHLPDVAAGSTERNLVPGMEIADRLVVSVRTVESHIHRAMHKLGVSDRRDLRTGPSQVQ